MNEFLESVHLVRRSFLARFVGAQLKQASNLFLSYIASDFWTNEEQVSQQQQRTEEDGCTTREGGDRFASESIVACYQDYFEIPPARPPGRPARALESLCLANKVFRTFVIPVSSPSFPARWIESDVSSLFFFFPCTKNETFFLFPSSNCPARNA